jgi:flagellar biosynthesis protein FliQ
METISTYLIAGSLIAAVLFIAGAVLLWFLGWVAGLVAAICWAVTKVHDVFRGRDDDIG